MLSGFDKRANELWNAYQAQLKRIREDGNLSPQGKADQAARALATYKAAIEQLQAQARAQADSERRTAQLALALEQAREIKQLRADVGNDVLAAAIIRERLEASTSAEIQATAESVKDDPWARAVVFNYGRLIVTRRAGERPSAADNAALDAMKPKRYSGDVEYEQRLRELEPKQVDRWIDDLDRGARAQTFADKFHVSAQHVPLPADA